MDDSRHLLMAAALILSLGVGGQWLAWRLKVPGVLVLLTIGCLFGWLGVLQPDQTFGKLLQPAVSLSVAFILFEGGLTLKFSDIRPVLRPVGGLLSIGVLVTWIGATLAAHWMLDMPFRVALVLGAVLTVTGPTVIGPLLREIRPSGKVGVVAKWEGIVIDPIGATLAVLVFEASEAIQLNQYSSATLSMVAGFSVTAMIGVIFGALGAVTLTEALRRYWVPDYLQNSVALMSVTLAYVGAELIHREAGLVSVTVMGIWLANQRFVDTHGILEFKETLTVLLIACLFIVLSARIQLSQIVALGWGGLAFAATMIAVIRPTSVFLATTGGHLTIRERLFLGWFAPRGIVAAAVSSVFALRMGDGGAMIAPATFVMIVTTVAVYGLTAGPLARRLHLAVADPQGVLIAGANPVARSIALALHKTGIETLLVDTRYEYVAKARDLGLRVHYANILSDYVIDELNLGGIGRFLAVTSNDEVNTLAAARFRSYFGNRNVYQIAPRTAQSHRLSQRASERFEGRNLFLAGLNYGEFDQRLNRGATVKATKLTPEFTLDDLQDRAPNCVPLFFAKGNSLTILAVDTSRPLPVNGQTVIYLADAQAIDASTAAAFGAEGSL